MTNKTALTPHFRGPNLPDTTLVVIAADGVNRGLVGVISMGLERRGLRLVTARTYRLSREDVAALYPGLSESPLRRHILAYQTDGPAVVMAWTHRSNAVLHAREVADQLLARWSTGPDRRVVRASADADGADADIGRFFPQLARARA